MFPDLFSRDAHHPQRGESLSEAFLNISSVRDILPEQHRAHFDELRGGILAFCKEFEIPVETLRNKEAFGAELTSKRIPQERMTEAVLLFARLEYLVTNKEPLKVESEALKEVEPLYHLKEQYTSQVSLLERVGILKEGVIVGIDGHEYPIPTLEQIASRLLECEPELHTKRDQGFTKLLLVPFGMSLDALIDTFRQFLLTYKQTHKDFDLATIEPLPIWKEGYQGADLGDSPKLVYFPQSFDKHDHQGQTKAQILEEQASNTNFSFPGWKIHLFQSSNSSDSKSLISSIPREGRGYLRGEEFPRPDLETGQTPTQYLSLLQKAKDDPGSPYHGESGLTPEDWILAFMTHLAETGQPLDNYYQNDTNNFTFLIGAFFQFFALVPVVYWINGARRVGLDRSTFVMHNKSYGVRTSVVV